MSEVDESVEVPQFMHAYEPPPQPTADMKQLREEDVHRLPEEQ